MALPVPLMLPLRDALRVTVPLLLLQPVGLPLALRHRVAVGVLLLLTLLLRVPLPVALTDPLTVLHRLCVALPGEEALLLGQGEGEGLPLALTHWLGESVKEGQ